MKKMYVVFFFITFSLSVNCDEHPCRGLANEFATDYEKMTVNQLAKLHRCVSGYLDKVVSIEPENIWPMPVVPAAQVPGARTPWAGGEESSGEVSEAWGGVPRTGMPESLNSGEM